MACKHENARKVLAGAPMKWCSHCGLFFDGTRWHRTAEKHAAAARKRAPAQRASKHKKPRSPAQKAATARMLAARAKRGHAKK
jgi:hypothetical protein